MSPLVVLVLAAPVVLVAARVVGEWADARLIERDRRRRMLQTRRPRVDECGMTAAQWARLEREIFGTREGSK